MYISLIFLFLNLFIFIIDYYCCNLLFLINNFIIYIFFLFFIYLILNCLTEIILDTALTFFLLLCTFSKILITLQA